MKKLFYEVSPQFKPTHYLVMARIHEEFEPMTFDPITGRFCRSFENDEPMPSGEAAEVYDKQTAITLMGHDALNSKIYRELKLFPVYVQEPPQLYMIFGRRADCEDDMPTPLCQGDTSPLTWSRVFTNSDLPIPEVFDLETAEALIKRQHDFQRVLHEDDTATVLFDMYIVPLNANTSSKYSNPYLNPEVSLDTIVEKIIEDVDYCRSLNPDAEDDARHMPASLGGDAIVPAKLNNHISSPVTPVQ